MVRSLTQEFVRRIFDYDPETGVLTWRVRDDFPTAHLWNPQFAGKPAGNATGRGYWVVGINGRSITAHRIVWIWVHGSLPEADIDHINCDKADNRIANLRAASRSQNSANRPPPKNNKSGYKGVHFDRGRQRWMAYIKKDWKRHHLGRFDSKEEAIAAYETAALKMFGEFARDAA